MKSAANIRQATLADQGTLEALFTQTGTSFDPATELNRDCARIWLAEFESSPAALLLTWQVADELQVLDLCTVPDLRRRGFARSLLQTALAYAQSQRLGLVLLEVRRSNAPALCLYRSVGFAAVRLRRSYYADGEDAVEMLLVLDPETGQVSPISDEITLET